MKGVYKGEHRDPEGVGGGIVTFEDDHGIEYLEGELNWGYGGSGPAALAKALVYHNLSLEPGLNPETCRNLAERLHQRVKWHTASTFEKGRPWTMTAFTVRAIIEKVMSQWTQ